jgi:hypothetical protein
LSDRTSKVGKTEWDGCGKQWSSRQRMDIGIQNPESIVILMSEGGSQN